jgi:hypothetical protein
VGSVAALGCRLWLMLRALYVVLVPTGLLLLMLSEGFITPGLTAYAVARSRHGAVSPEGLRQMILTVRLAGAVCATVGMAGLGSVMLVGWLGWEGCRSRVVEPPAPLRTSGVVIAGICALVVVVLVLPRITNGLGYDEASTVLWFVDPRRPYKALFEFKGLNNHPFFSILASLSEALLGRAEWVFRCPSVVAAAAAVVSLFFLARRFGGVRAATVASLLLALAPPVLLYAAQARGYALLILFSVLSSLALLRVMEAPGLGRWSAYVVTCGLGTWSHFSMLLVVMSHGAGVLGLAVSRRKLGRPAGFGSAYVVAVAAILLVVLALYAVVLPKLLFEIVGFSLVERAKPMVWEAAAGSVWDNVVGILAGEWAHYSIAQRAFAALAGGAATIGAWRSIREFGAQQTVPLVAPVTIALAVCLAFRMGKFGAYRFFIAVLPLTILFVAAGVEPLARRSQLWGLCLGLLLLTLEGQGLAQYYQIPRAAMPQFAGLIRERIDGRKRLVADWWVGNTLPYYLDDRAVQVLWDADDARRTISAAGGEIFLACKRECPEQLDSRAPLQAVEILSVADDDGTPLRLIRLRNAT